MLKSTRLLFTAASLLLPLATQAFTAADTSRIPQLTACITRADGSQLLDVSELSPGLPAGSPVQVIQLDSSRRYQTVSGFGYTLTGASALLIAGLPDRERTELLREIFGTTDNQAAVSYLRIGMGASDLDTQVFSYNDLAPGMSDPELRYFNLSRDTLHLIPLLRQILAIQPGLRIMASPWSPPVWMKTNGSSIGGRLKPSCYDVYARYFVKYIQSVKARGIPIDAVTIQNEPFHGGNNPSMEMSAAEQADFIKNHLGPAFRSAGIRTKILIWDHNCDHPEFPIEVLSDPAAKAWIHGSAFHLYAGEPAAMSAVHEAHPDKAIFFTEQWTGAKGDFGGDLRWHLKNVVIGALRNWSEVVLEWNLANDPDFSLHTPGGCHECRGAFTISNAAVSRNVSYYVISQVSRFVPPGAVRIESNLPPTLPNVAFVTPAGKFVLLVLNEQPVAVSFAIQQNGRQALVSLPPESAGTFSWR